MQYWCSILTLFLVFQGAPCAAEEPPLRLATLEYPPYITQVDEHAKGLVVDVVNEAFRVSASRYRSSSSRLRAGRSGS